MIHSDAEERGLLGSRWHAVHPRSCPKKVLLLSLLNGDMIGRNDNNEAALLGGDAPTKNSEGVVKMSSLDARQCLKREVRVGLKVWIWPEHP